MLSSKELIERTGISRATLNNYIRSGLIPRPDVLPPEPQHGGAPRIGYFPDDVLDRVETIQRLKREGWSLQRILSFFAAHPGQLPPAGAPAPARPVPPAAGATPGLTLSATGQPTYLVDESFRLDWVNEAARSSQLSPLAGADETVSGGLFNHLPWQGDAATRAILQFHLQAAKSRGLAADVLFGQLPPEAARELDALYRRAAPHDGDLVTQAVVPRSGDIPARLVHAVQFQEGVLFAYTLRPADAQAEAPTPASPVSAPPRAAAWPAQAVTIAVMATRLQDAGDLWVRLGVQEYFELVNDVSAQVHEVVRAHHGHAVRLSADRLVCYFLPRAGANPLLQALAAADATKAALRDIDRRWKLRKNWDFEVCVNAGLAEGEAWVAGEQLAGEADLQVIGDVKAVAAELARSGPRGAILVTRNLIEKLPLSERERAIHGVPPHLGSGSPSHVLRTFARLRDIAVHETLPRRVAGLAVAELLEFAKKEH